MLYPMKFAPLFKERIWGGRKMEEKFGKQLPADVAIGESWELSGVEGDVSVVANGKLAGNSLAELIEVYMGDLVGDKVYEQYGEEFPILIKLIDADDVLSIQVHPDDELSKERHNAYGKTEMWYIIDNEPDASLYLGFNQEVDQEKYLEYLNKGALQEILGEIKVKPGDAYFIPAGAIHAIGKGILIAEIQQTSDITYRVFDWNRVDANGNGRELHTELAIDAINFNDTTKYDITVTPKANENVQMQSCKYFTSSVIEVDGTLVRDYYDRDSFNIYMCLEGEISVKTKEGVETMTKGETILIPAVIDAVELSGKGKIIEVFM
ncbi:MAG: type I phosphomannose isomerase catalytic subunit [Rikenellaceae bacterium]